MNLGNAQPRRGARAARSRGAVLLEAILALTLLVASGTVILGSLNGAMRVTRQVRTEARAADLAVTVLSELQLGLREQISEGPSAFLTDEQEEDPDLVDWTWEIAVEDVEPVADAPSMIRVNVIIRHTPSNTTHRLQHLFPPTDAEDAGGDYALGTR